MDEMCFGELSSLPSVFAIHMRLPKVQPKYVNAAKGLVISGFSIGRVIYVHSASPVIRKQLISIKCMIFHAIVVQNINGICFVIYR